MIGVAAITVRWFLCWVHSRVWFQQANNGSKPLFSGARRPVTSRYQCWSVVSRPSALLIVAYRCVTPNGGSGLGAPVEFLINPVSLLACLLVGRSSPSFNRHSWSSRCVAFL